MMVETARTGASGDCRVIIDGVSYRQEARRIIDEISLELTEQRIGIVGLNGSGKTTLARLVCGLIRPTAGKIVVNGANVADDRKAALRSVGMVFQNPDHQIIFPTVAEEISFGLAQQGCSKADAAQRSQATLDEFGRSDWSGRAVHTLSQGQRHLVCIMAVMAMQPSLLVLDEPFSGPDIPTVRQLHRQLNRLNVAQLLISHDLRHLQEFERIIWLDQGRVRGDGAAETVLAEYSEEIDRMGALDAFADFPDQDAVS